MTGRVHSIESMGLVDGPGIRAVVFLQGCALRCRYCHNPDTWELAAPCAPGAGTVMEAEELVRRLVRFKPYFESSGGGVTFSGGEPLQQPDFLLDCLKRCKAAGLHTCIDTAGVGRGAYEEILQYTDLVLYDVKHFTPEGYKAVTGCEKAETDRFLDAVRRAGTPLWVRHVVVPGLTDGDAHIAALAAYIKTLPNVQRAELLGYHLLGREKYKRLGLPYSLEGVPPLGEDERARLQALLEDC